MTDLTVIEGTSKALRKLFSVHENARICFIDAEPGDWGHDENRYLASHECDGAAPFDIVIELWAIPDCDPAHPWMADWVLYQSLNYPSSITFCPHCGLNLYTLFTDPFAGLTP